MSLAQDLMKQAGLGIDAEAFLRSDVGKALVAKLETEVEELTDELKQADPTNAVNIARLQRDIGLREYLPYFLGECITSGQHAEVQLSQLEPPTS